MEIKIGIFVVCTLCSTLGNTISVNPGNQPTHLSYVPVATSDPGDRYARNTASSQRRNSTDQPAERFPYGREIIEISDPTTDSTLHLPHYPPIDCTNKKECDAISGDTTPMPTFRPYTQEELNGFLKKYVEHNGQMPDNDQTDEPSNKLANIYMDEAVNVLEGDKESGKSQEKSKSWQLMQAQAHKHPYDDRTGWVTLEPVPWSSSQIQKWEPNKRPSAVPQWNEDPPQTQSSWNRPSPSKWPEKPWNNKNTYEYKPSAKPWTDKYNSKPSSWNSNSDSWGAGSDIITEDGPSQFPHEPARPTWYERPQTEVVYQGEKEQYNHPQSHPSEGDGRWVLLSSTKGYSVPHRSRAHQRSLFVTGKTPATGKVPSVKSHRSVRLTVLPPLNGTMNTTTIHGGLVEVEQTMQTVDEAHREHLAKMLKLESVNASGNAQKPPPVASKRSGTAIRIYPMRSPQSQARNNAMLAAVGAGMIPATVAMMLPMVLGRRRRSLEQTQHRLEHLQFIPYIHHQ
ncbi:hypothetical protein GE061_018710 [Apolygus lucorum]|uniref:Uncharacterized protein n=1 Tax=Apolygus lucorum TaxID=248454 RepID=A0A6A4JEA8_APOLU|nr:hypothetical protein GE061_018710 [Apolygus lucorum]